MALRPPPATEIAPPRARGGVLIMCPRGTPFPRKGRDASLSDPRTSTLSDSKAPDSTRLSFGKIPEILRIPDLIAIQRQSFEWLMTSGLRETFDEISPIEDYTGQMALTF